MGYLSVNTVVVTTCCIYFIHVNLFLPFPGMMMGGNQMLGRNMMMSPQQPKPPVAPVMNGSAIPGTMMPGMVPTAMIPSGGSGMAMGMASQGMNSMPVMMGMMTPQPPVTGPVSMTNNLGL